MLAGFPLMNQAKSRHLERTMDKGERKRDFQRGKEVPPGALQGFDGGKMTFDADRGSGAHLTSRREKVQRLA